MEEEKIKTITIFLILIISNIIISYVFVFPLALFVSYMGYMSGLTVRYLYLVLLILIFGLLFVILGIKKIGGILCIISGILTLPIGILVIIAGVIGMNLSKKK